MFERIRVVASWLLVLGAMGFIGRTVMAQESSQSQGNGSGLIALKSKRSFDETVAAFKQAVKDAKLAIVFEANHKNMMALVGIESPPSVTIGFARPQMGNMVLSAEPRAAIDMPLRVAIRQLDDGSVVVLCYRPSYLFGMWKNERLTKPGSMADQMVVKFIKAATDNGERVFAVPYKDIKDNLRVVKSSRSFDETVAGLKAAIKEKQLAIVFEANHKNMMALVGIESNPSVTIGFARPQMGNMVLSAEPRAAVEMPLRVAVRELDNEDVVVVYFDPAWLFSHYDNAKLDKVARMASMMVKGFVAKATGAE